MKTLQGFVLAISALATMGAQAITKDEVIRDALQKGAVIVVCDNGICKNTRTQEVVGTGPDGQYLTYPQGREQEERQTARLLARAG